MKSLFQRQMDRQLRAEVTRVVSLIIKRDDWWVRRRDGKQHKEGEKNQEMRAGLNTEVRKKWDAIVRRGAGDWRAALIGCSRCWTHTHTHTSRWGGLMVRERELPLSSTEDSHLGCHMDNTYFKWPYYLFMRLLCVFVCVCVHVSLCSYLPCFISRR